MADLHDLFESRPDESILRAQLQEWENEVYRRLGAAGKSDLPAVKFSGRVPLDELFPADRTEMINKYREITGLNVALNRLAETPTDQVYDWIDTSISPEGRERISNVWAGLDTFEGREGSRYGRFRGSADGSLLGRVFGAINLQFYDRNRPDRTGFIGEGEYVTRHFGIGSIPTLESLDRGILADRANKKVFLFDLETAGFRPGALGQFGYEMFKTDAVGKAPEQPYARVEHFRPISGARGSQLDEAGRIVDTEQLITRPSSIPLTSSGDEFIERIMPILDKASRADVVVGHNILGFDLPYIFKSLAQTRRYAEDPDFKVQIDALFKDLKPKVFDTLVAARQASNLSGIGINDALRGRTTGAFSIENLLLETDLAKRIGLNRIDELFGVDAKLHSSDVDNIIDRALFEHMDQLRVGSIVGTGRNANENLIIQKMIKQVVNSAALTPFTDIEDPKMIHQRVKDLLGTDAKVNRLEHEILMERNLELGGSQSALDAARAGIDPRRLLPGLGSFDRLIGRSQGMSWAKVYDDLIKPPHERFVAYQQGLADMNMPFAGLSREERIFGTALADITHRVGRRPADRLAREALTARWELFDPRQIQYVAQGSGKLTLPIQVLREAGLLDNMDNPALFGVSIVQPTQAKASRSVNLAYELRAGDREQISRVLSRMLTGQTVEPGFVGPVLGAKEEFARVMGMADATSKEVAEAFDNFERAMRGTRKSIGDERGVVGLLDQLNADSTERYGVTVAQLMDEGAAEEINDLLAAFNNNENLRDATRMPMRTAFAGMRGNEVITAGAFLDRGLGASLRDIGRQVQLSMAITDPSRRNAGFGGLTRNWRMTKAAEAMDAGRVVSGFPLKFFDYMEGTVVPNLPKITLGALGLGLAGYLYSRKRRTDRYDIDFEYAGQQPGPSRYAVADVLQARIDAGYNGARRQVDPLATASLTDHLYYSSIGHTDMRWDRNQNIYGGVL
jgi:hypothetical protein